MGTRNLTMVINKVGETKIAQYGQWDGYPEGQGVTILEFLRGKGNMEKLQKGLERVRFVNDDDEKNMEEFLKSIGAENGWMNSGQSKKYKQRYPYLSRDIGGEILELVANSSDMNDVMLHDSTDFAADSLFCEWAYVVDFQKGIFEVYRGFQQGKVEGRFAEMETKENNKYSPVTLIETFNLDNLPNKDEFINKFVGEEEEYEDD